MLKKLILVFVLSAFSLAVATIPAYAFAVQKPKEVTSASMPCHDMDGMTKKTDDTTKDCCKDSFSCFQQCLSKVGFMHQPIKFEPAFAIKIYPAIEQSHFVFIPDPLLRPPKA